MPNTHTKMMESGIEEVITSNRAFKKMPKAGSEEQGERKNALIQVFSKAPTERLRKRFVAIVSKTTYNSKAGDGKILLRNLKL